MRTFLPLVLASTLLAQQQEPFVIRSTTKLVMLNVTAVDSKGHPVTDLKAADFVVTENGQSQQIAAFEMIGVGVGSDQPTPKLPPNVFSNRVERAGARAGVTVILLDYLNTSWTDAVRSKAQVIAFLSTIEPGDRVALYSLGTKLKVIHDFTTDSSSLLARLSSSRGELTRHSEVSVTAPLQARSDALDPFAPIDPDLEPPTARELETMTNVRFQTTLKAMEAIASHISGVPGRKSLVWVSAGFPMVLDPSIGRTYGEEVFRTTRALNHAGVAIYPVDARGLMINPTLNADARGHETPIAPTSAAWTPPNIDTLKLIASRTGGKAYFNRNDISGAIREISDQGKVTYTLGYYPSGEADDRYRDVKVRVTRSGVTVGHRKGYFATANPKVTQAEVEKSIAQSVWSPIDSSAIAIQARVNQNARTGDLTLVVQVDPANLTLEKQADRWIGRLDVAVVQRSAEAKTQNLVFDTVHLRLPQERVSVLLRDGMKYLKTVPRQPEATTIRVVVRDGASGITGTVTIPLQDIVAETAAATASQQR